MLFLYTSNKNYLELQNVNIVFVIIPSKSEMLRYKYHKICSGYVNWKLQNVDGRN
jgi:hypothetical protein